MSRSTAIATSTNAITRKCLTSISVVKVEAKNAPGPA
jgi:hypothetical protein